jgi:signal transduction histidine kinase
MGGPDPVGGGGAFGGRYQPERLLKSGLGAETFLGRELESRLPVVIKLTAAEGVSPSAQLRLEHEAEVLRGLEVPWIAPLFHVGREGEVFYLVTPFVPGVTLAERIARAGRLSVPDTLAVGRGVLRALRAAHERGVLHRDVKPANVVVGEGSPPERVTLIDFGLARNGQLHPSLRDLPVETIAYISPEQAGLTHAEVGERSDLYSAGVLLFECLAGRPPFQGVTAGEILRQHLTARAPELRALGRPVPRALDDLIGRLLEKDPRDRYQSAAAALADLDEIAAAMARGVREPAVGVGAHDRRRTLTEPAFVGRGGELHAIEAELDRVPGGRSPLLLLEGESGVGKTRLLDEVAVAALHRGAWVLRGQAADRAPQRPLQILDRMVAEIVQAARTEPGFAEALRARLGEHLETLCSALPELLGLLAPGMLVSLGPEAHGEARTLPALVALLDALGAPARPAVLLLDDCQWLDELSLKLIVHWHRAQQARAGPGGVLLIAAYRSEEVPGESPLRRIEPVCRVTLGPLAPEEVDTLLESMAGALPSEAIDLVERLSEGNPFLAAAVLEGLAERGALFQTPRGWELEPRAMAEAQSSDRAAAFLAQRVDKLPRPVLQLLSVGAVLGRSFELKLAAELARESATEAMAGVAEARRRHLVWMDSPGTRCAFVHDRLREVFLERLTPAGRRRLHRVVALSLDRAEAGGPDREFDLAYHFDAAGDHARALPHALSAAAQARGRNALETAERYYRIAARGVGDESVDAGTRRRVAEGLGDVLLMRGRYPEAGACFTQARALGTSSVERAAIEGKIGELAFKRGDVRAASEALERALRILGRRVPSRLPALVAATLVQALVQWAHTLLPRRWVARRRLEDGEADLLAARIYSRLAYASWFLRGQVATFWAHLSELNLAERYPPTRELAQACSEHAISVTGLPRVFFSRGARYAERGLAIRRDLGDVWGQGQSLNFHGILLYAFGQYTGALEKFREALRLLRRTGDRWEANIAGLHIAFCLYRLGALREAAAECRRVHREGLEIGDAHAMAGGLEVWAKATGGAVPQALVDAAMRRSEGDPQAREIVLQAQAVRSIGAGRPREAARDFTAADELARSVNLRSEYVSYLPIWIAHAQRLRAVQAAAETGVLLRPRLREAEAALRRGLRRARRYRGNLPMALRERAHLRALRGRFRGARRDLDESLAWAERGGARFEAAQTLLARGELGRALGWPGADAEAARARRLLHEMGAGFACSALRTVEPGEVRGPALLSLGDRLASVAEQGRRIASALAPEDVYASVCEAACVLLQGVVSLVLTAEPEPRILAHRGDPPELSRSLIERALEARQPTLLTELPEGALAESLPSGPRSALSAPILVGGRPAACIYLMHPLVGDLFGEEEKGLAGYLAALAGASLEKSEADAAMQALSRALEGQVAARTSELEATVRRLRETQEQYVQAAKMAEASTLMAGLTHELNGPLGVILGYAKTSLRRVSEEDPLRPAMEAIERQAQRCADLVRSFLDLSRKHPGMREEVALDALVHRVVGLASAKARRQGLRLELELPPPGTFRVRVSSTQIESALLNVLDNAVDASPQGGTVRLGARPAERRGCGGVEVSVRDQGAGIDPGVLPRIFDPFFTTKPVGQGTGLGLPLARQFVEEHGGELSIEGCPTGRGTIVRVWLPLCDWPGQRAVPGEAGGEA